MVTSEPVKILEFYMRSSGEDWKRDTSLEVSLRPEVAHAQGNRFASGGGAA